MRNRTAETIFKLSKDNIKLNREYAIEFFKDSTFKEMADDGIITKEQLKEIYHKLYVAVKATLERA